MKQNKYLVACYNERDALNAMMQTFAKMQQDFVKDTVKYSTNSMSISNKQLIIVFVTENVLVAMSQYKVIFDGVKTTKKFDINAKDSTKGIYRESYLHRTLEVNKQTDLNGILSMYLWRGR